MIIWRIRLARAALSRPSPARRPRRLSFKARRPPSLSSAIHLFAARKLTPKTLAASVWLIPPRTACTRDRRTCANAAVSNFRASFLLVMLGILSYYALFDARISNMLTFHPVRSYLPASRFVGRHLRRRATPIWLVRVILRKWLKPAGSLPSMDNSNAPDQTCTQTDCGKPQGALRLLHRGPL